MKLRGKRDYQTNWVQTITSGVLLIFAILTGTGIITPEQSAAAAPIITSVIAGVFSLIGLFFKQSGDA